MGTGAPSTHRQIGGKTLGRNTLNLMHLEVLPPLDSRAAQAAAMTRGIKRLLPEIKRNQLLVDGSEILIYL